jgi:hypothetical protein
MLRKRITSWAVAIALIIAAIGASVDVVYSIASKTTPDGQAIACSGPGESTGSSGGGC